MLIFIVEDNTALALVYTEALNHAGFETEVVTDGREALARLDTLSPDLFLLDMNLPHVSGHYLLQQIRSEARFATTPIIIATANTVLAEALRPELDERCELFIKPLRPTDLIAVARRLCGE